MNRKSKKLLNKSKRKNKRRKSKRRKSKDWFPLNIIIVLAVGGVAVLIWGLVTNWAKGHPTTSPSPPPTHIITDDYIITDDSNIIDMYFFHQDPPAAVCPTNHEFANLSGSAYFIAGQGDTPGAHPWLTKYTVQLAGSQFGEYMPLEDATTKPNKCDNCPAGSTAKVCNSSATALVGSMWGPVYQCEGDVKESKCIIPPPLPPQCAITKTGECEFGPSCYTVSADNKLLNTTTLDAMSEIVGKTHVPPVWFSMSNDGYCKPGETLGKDCTYKIISKVSIPSPNDSDPNALHCFGYPDKTCKKDTDCDSNKCLHVWTNSKAWTSNMHTFSVDDVNYCASTHDDLINDMEQSLQNAITKE